MLDSIQDELRARLLKYTRDAFQQLPHIEHPEILDVGCGSGIPTVELALLSGGRVTGIDIDEEALNRLQIRAKALGVANQIRTISKSLRDMEFPDESFDIIWAEGSIAVIGFEQGLRAWQRFLKTGGFLVVHDEASNLDQKLVQIAACGYSLIDYYVIKEEVWWQEYYAPLQKRIQPLLAQKIEEPKLQAALKQAEQEIEGYRVNPQRYRSAFFIMRK